VKNRKIVLALTKLNKQELQRFRVFLESPYFNVNQDVLALYVFVFSYLVPNRLDKMPEDSETWTSLIPDKPFDARRLNLLYFYLSNRFDDFISQQEYENLVYFKEKVKCEIIGQAGLTSWQKDLVKKNLKELDGNNDFSSNVAINQYFIKNTVTKDKMNIEALHYLKLFYILEKMYAHVTLLSWKKMYQLDVEIKFMDQIFYLIKSNNLDSFPSIAVYQSIIGTFLNEEDKERYYLLRSLIKQHIHKFNIDFQREIYTMAISYCINKSNQSIAEFDKEEFDLFKESVEGNIIQENNEISVPVFRNIVFVSLKVKEFQWAENFIENYQKYIHPKFRDNAVYFSLARLEINRNNYEKVLDYLQLINYEDVWYQLGARTMQMAAYYKLGEFDALESLLNAYKMFITREKSLTKERKTAYLNLIKYTKKLLYVLPDEKSKINKMRKEIEDNKTIVNKSWLLERVDELTKSKY
jgi:hypothetical protein